MENFLSAIELINECRKSGNLDGAINVCSGQLLENRNDVTFLSLLATIVLERGEGIQRVSSVLNNIICADLMRRGDEFVGSGQKDKAERLY